MQSAKKLLDLTLETPAENLALDEALLLEAEESDTPQSVLRLWHPTQHFIVLGQSCRYKDEVHVEFCDQNKIPILRRSSGGGTILTGPGCLMYGMIVPYENQLNLRMIDQAHRFVLARILTALNSAFVDDSSPLNDSTAPKDSSKAIFAESKGYSDLVVGNLKFSGNAMRCKRRHFLYHGTLLCDFDLNLIPKTLKAPPREPDYRSKREHSDFLMNLEPSIETVKQALIWYWQGEVYSQWPQEQTEKLAAEKYESNEWNFKR